MPITLIHLSDLHLGSDFLLRSLWRRRKWWNTEDRDLLHNLEHSIRETGPDYVVITGDIVNKCTRRNFERTAYALRKLLSNAGVDIKKQVLVIPGNHDVKVLPAEDENFGRLSEFLKFLKDLFAEKDRLTRKAKFVRLDIERQLCFFCLDTTFKDKQPVAEGQVGAGQIAWLLDKYNGLRTSVPDFDRFIKVVALHHHPHPVNAGGQERFMQLLDNAEVISTFQRLGVNLVLHG